MRFKTTEQITIIIEILELTAGVHLVPFPILIVVFFLSFFQVALAIAFEEWKERIIGLRHS
jgi:hypothetical protein